jgi:hypothetical protein
MNLKRLLTGILLIIPFYVSHGNFFTDYQNRYYTKVISNIPDNASNLILIISTRDFNPADNYSLKRGVDPWYQKFCFIAGLINDTAFIMPLHELSEAAKYLPLKRDMLIYVDGYGKTFGQTMERGFELTDRFNLNMIIFDWPTDYLSLRTTIYNAAEVSVNFVKAMQDIEQLHLKYYSQSAVSVVFHSMGNHILQNICTTSMLQHMPKSLFSNIIINAAAVKRRNHYNWVEKLEIQKRIYITMNDRDFNLRGAAVIRLAKQLGMGNNNHRAKNAYYVNFNDIATTEHNLFLGKSHMDDSYPDIFRFYDLVFHGKEVGISENMGFQILSPSDNSFLFSVK